MSFAFSRNYFDPIENRSIPTLFLKLSELNQKHKVVSTFKDNKRNDIFKLELSSYSNYETYSHDYFNSKWLDLIKSPTSNWKLSCDNDVRHFDLLKRGPEFRKYFVL